MVGSLAGASGQCKEKCFETEEPQKWAEPLEAEARPVSEAPSRRRMLCMSFAQSSGDSQNIVTRVVRASDPTRGLGAFPRAPLILALDS